MLSLSTHLFSHWSIPLMFQGCVQVVLEEVNAPLGGNWDYKIGICCWVILIYTIQIFCTLNLYLPDRHSWACNAVLIRDQRYRTDPNAGMPMPMPDWHSKITEKCRCWTKCSSGGPAFRYLRVSLTCWMFPFRPPAVWTCRVYFSTACIVDVQGVSLSFTSSV